MARPFTIAFLILLIAAAGLSLSAAQSTEPGTTAESREEAGQAPDSELPEPVFSDDLSALPFPVRRMRELILEAAESADIEKLRALIGTGDSMTMLSLGGFDGDPIEFLKTQSGDADGHELLAILSEILEAGYARMDAGTGRELYVWPYFFAKPLDQLDDKEMVALFRIVTYGDYQEMKDFGGYIFYRVGIAASGRWEFFVAGD